ncbi:MAG: thermonuclease family protein [Gammaproteobacteria bacterium]
MVVPFFCWIAPAQILAADCLSRFYDSKVEVKRVFDGDTFQLTDGRKVRIIGINTPELERDNKPADPLAYEARDALKNLLKENRHIQLRLGKEKYDRYHRLLAHPFLADGTNITEQLLKKGLGFALLIPPNNWQSECYRQAENHAREQKLGLWKHPYYQPVAAERITKNFRGYYRVKGKVGRIGESRNAYWLNLSSGFALRISKKDARYFHALPVESLKDKTITARGWVYERNNEMRMNVHHPAALEVVN